MKGKTRSLFPGGNTAEGFFSYYQYILEQDEAVSLICLKGGPGTGKSSFMKNIGKYFTEKGEDVDFFWCSSDPDSLDGVLLRERKTAIIDGTSPHVVDPINPGAVDSILNMGEFWDGDIIRQYKSHILQSNSKIKQWFSFAYNNLRSAAAVMESVREIYKNTMLPGELYKETSGIINREMSHHPVTLAEGKRKKYFASAITPKGAINHLETLIKGYSKIYVLNAPAGFETSEVLRIVSEHAVHRGFPVEEYYCPMAPETKMEHLLIPELDMAMVTLNPYHDMELCGEDSKIITVEMRDLIDWNRAEPYLETIDFCEKQSDILIRQAIEYLKNAKDEHDRLESYYVPNMNFQKIEELTAEIIGKIERKVL